MATSVPGLFAAGEAEYQHHGANRLGANSLLSCIFDGMVAGPAAVHYVEGLERRTIEVGLRVFDLAVSAEREKNAKLSSSYGGESPFTIYREMGDVMRKNVTVIRHNDMLRKTDAKLVELMERYNNITLPDRSEVNNQSLVFARELYNMLVLARVITQAALARDESRGAHFKQDFPLRDDAAWLKTTKATYTQDGPKLEYEPVDVSLIPPRERHYEE